jgi:hypothetical protein
VEEGDEHGAKLAPLCGAVKTGSQHPRFLGLSVAVARPRSTSAKTMTRQNGAPGPQGLATRALAGRAQTCFAA